MLVSAAWSTYRAPVTTAVKLSAIAVDMAGASATFTIRDADNEDAVVGTLSGVCDDKGVVAWWTTPASAPPARFAFEVTADGKQALSGVLVLVRDFQVSLLLDGEPAAGCAVRLRVEPGAHELRGSADDNGLVRLTDVPFGDVTLFLEDS
ncbi:MAG: hypothetical protein ACTHU0_28800 [Kofleriaceae bacterium]